MTKAMLLLMCILTIGAVAAHQANGQALNPANGHYYQAVPVASGVDWYTANASANSLSYKGLRGHLAVITSAAENAFIYANLPIVHDWWLGAYQPTGSTEPAGGWTWVTGEAWVYTNWNPVQPDNGGGTEDGLEWWADGTWNDGTRTMSSGSLGYIVEYESVPEPSGIIAFLGGVSSLGALAWRRNAASRA